MIELLAVIDACPTSAYAPSETVKRLVQPANTEVVVVASARVVTAGNNAVLRAVHLLNAQISIDLTAGPSIPTKDVQFSNEELPMLVATGIYKVVKLEHPLNTYIFTAVNFAALKLVKLVQPFRA